MTRELQSVLAAVQTAPLEQLPGIVGGLAEIQAIALARLSQPPAVSPAVEETSSTLNVQGAAAYIGMSQKWIYRHQDILPCVRIGFGRNPRLRFRRCDLDGWLQKHRMET